MVQSLKDLEKLLKLCRKQGVTEITTTDVSFKLGEIPTKTLVHEVEDQEEQYLNFPDGPLTNEELTFFASGGNPEDNPYRRNEN